MSIKSSDNQIKWGEIYSLAALSAAIAISWIAYHEYQPQLLVNLQLEDLTTFLIVAKAIVLVTIPPLAGLIADSVIKKSGKFFLVFTVGIGVTAMIFMVVASLLNIEWLLQINWLLPTMLVLWLVGMNIFVSPAVSMIDTFAPKEKLPIVVGVIFLITELIYALEPLVIQLVDFFGPTLTFVIGGVLIGGTGYVYQRIASNEISDRRKELEENNILNAKPNYGIILIVGLIIGVGKAGLTEYIPIATKYEYELTNNFGNFLSFGLLGLSAILAFIMSRYIAKIGITKTIYLSSAGMIISTLLLLLSQSLVMFVTSGILMAISFGFINVSGLPFAISRLPVRHITFGVGILLGATELVSGLLEYYHI